MLQPYQLAAAVSGYLCCQVIPLEFFEGQSADGQFVPIVAGGSSLPLTFSNRRAYVDCAIQFRLHEMDLQVGCGLSHVNIFTACTLFSLADVEYFYCPYTVVCLFVNFRNLLIYLFFQVFSSQASKFISHFITTVTIHCSYIVTTITPTVFHSKLKTYLFRKTPLMYV